MHVDVARGIQQESDRSYSNDSITGANVDQPGPRGTGPSGGDGGRDDDGPRRLQHGRGPVPVGDASAGNVVELNTPLPSTSSWNGVVTVVNASGVAVADEDGNPGDGHFRGTIPADGTYYAKVEPVWSVQRAHVSC